MKICYIYNAKIDYSLVGLDVAYGHSLKTDLSRTEEFASAMHQAPSLLNLSFGFAMAGDSTFGAYAWHFFNFRLEDSSLLKKIMAT